MLKHEELCPCIISLMKDGKVSEYCPPYNEVAPQFNDVEEGQLCLAYDIVVDDGGYEDFMWLSDIRVYRELYPIEYCPVCGQKIEYKHINGLTKKY